jgi:sortase B
MPVWKRIIIAVLAIVFIACGVKLYFVWRDYKIADEIYAESRKSFAVSGTTEQAETETPEYFPDIEVDFATLQEKNPDVTGWIYLPDTEISYPLLYGQDNSRYTYISYDNTYSNSGSIFIDYRCAGDLSGRNTIIYGHNMRSGKMFGGLKKLLEQEYFDEHDIFYIVTKEKTLKYQIFSVHKTERDSDSYSFEFENTAAFENYIAAVKADSEIESDAAVTKSDTLVMLSTCTSTVWNERLVVHAVLIAEKEN